MANIVPPWVISGAASLAIRMKEWQDTSIARANPPAEQSSRPPWRSSFGAKAMEWMRLSSLPQRERRRSNRASICPGASTSSGAVMLAPSSRASGSTWARAFSLSQVMASSAPASRKARAQP
jgi:hypothetical protein